MASNPAPRPGAKRRCFVVMGFGIKTDFATGRKLDLDKSYRLLIKPVVEEKGVECIRADEILRSGTIDVPMYQELQQADVVIADISTLNPNALYELGIRHALRPFTTIVISENKLPYPFDLNHIRITSYTHLGDAIDYEEVVRFRGVLGATLQSVLDNQETDSPVYTFLKRLMPPSFGEMANGIGGLELTPVSAANVEEQHPQEAGPSLAVLIQLGEQFLKSDQFAPAKEVFLQAIRLVQQKKESAALAPDPYLIQRLALTTYKAKAPDERSALLEAQTLLAPLNPESSNDPETVGLAGAIEKRLFEQGAGDEHLGRSIRYYERGYFLRNDRYNGINVAFLLNVRADTPLDATVPEKIADLVLANRVRREVLTLCERELEEIRAREERLAKAIAATKEGEPVPSRGERAQRGQLSSAEQEQLACSQEQRFWCLATKAEAHFGLGQFSQFDESRSAARAIPHARWMMDTFDSQIQRLQFLLAKHGSLLEPPWKEPPAVLQEPQAPGPAGS